MNLIMGLVGMATLILIAVLFSSPGVKPLMADSALVINLGDLVKVWTNGVYVSNPHRVANRTGRERYSIPTFFNLDYDTPVARNSSDEVGDLSIAQRVGEAGHGQPGEPLCAGRR